MKRNWQNFKPSPDDIRRLGAQDYHEYAMACLLIGILRHALPEQVVFIGGTDLAFFQSLPRFSDDLDFKAPSLGAEDLARIAVRGVAEIDPTLRAGIQDLHPRLKDKAMVKVTSSATGQTALAGFNTLPLESLTAEPRSQMLLGVPVTVFRESSTERWFDKVLLLNSRILSPLRKCPGNESNVRARDIWDIGFLQSRENPFSPVTVESLVALAKKKPPREARSAFKEAADHLKRSVSVRKELLPVYTEEMLGIVDYPALFNAEESFSAAIRGAAKLVTEAAKKVR